MSPRQKAESPAGTLLHLLRADGNPGRSPLADPSPEVVEEALRHGVGPLLYSRMSKDGNAPRDTRGMERLRDVYLASRLRSRMVSEQLDGLGALANRLGTPVLALKGAQLAGQVYPDPALRPMEDVDLLLERHHLPVFRKALLNEGYRGVANDIDYGAMHHERPLRKAGGLPVELHHRLSREVERLEVDLQAIRARARKAPGVGRGLRYMDPGDLLLHLCTHAAYDHRFRIGLLSLCDVDILVRSRAKELDWTRLVDTATSDGRAPFVWVALQLTAKALGTALPREVRGLRHGKEEQAMVEVAWDHILSSHEQAPVGMQRMEGASGFVRKSGIFWSAVFPGARRMREIYDLPRGSLRLPAFYLVRPFDLLRRWGAKGLSMGLRVGAGREILEGEERRRRINRWVGQGDEPNRGHPAHTGRP